MVGLPHGKKTEDMITRFDTIHKRDRQQDGRADHTTTHAAKTALSSLSLLSNRPRIRSFV